MRITLQSDLTKLLVPHRERVRELMEGKRVAVTANWPVVELPVGQGFDRWYTIEVPPELLKVTDLRLIPEAEVNKDGIFLTGSSILSLLFSDYVLIIDVQPMISDILQHIYPQVIQRLADDFQDYMQRVQQGAESLSNKEGYIPARTANMRYIYKTLERMSQREGRPKPSPWDVFPHRDAAFFSTQFLRVRRRVLDHLAHAVSAGWVKVNWPTAGRIIKGERLAFRDGQRVDTIPEGEDVVEIHV